MLTCDNLDLISSLQKSPNLKQAVERIEKLWNLFQSSQVLPGDDLRPTISNSWQRCLDISWELLPESVRNHGPIPAHLPEKERERYLEFVRTYQEANGNITEVAGLLNISRPTVYSWLKRFGLN